MFQFIKDFFTMLWDAFLSVIYYLLDLVIDLFLYIIDLLVTFVFVILEIIMDIVLYCVSGVFSLIPDNPSFTSELISHLEVANDWIPLSEFFTWCTIFPTALGLIFTVRMILAVIPTLG